MGIFFLTVVLFAGVMHTPIFANPPQHSQNGEANTGQTPPDASETSQSSGGVIDQSTLNALFSSINANEASHCRRGFSAHQTINGNSRTVQKGQMPAGTFQGLVLTFARQKACSMAGQNDHPISTHSHFSNAVNSPNNKGKDAFSKPYFSSKMDQNAVHESSFALNFGLIMMETDGIYNKGKDASASNSDAETREAGAFQLSWNSRNLGNDLHGLFKELVTYYTNGSHNGASQGVVRNGDFDQEKCLSGVFRKGVESGISKYERNNPTQNLFQQAMKVCPALATDYMSLLSRTNYRHNGPLWREEIPLRSSCINVLKNVTAHLSNDGAADQFCSLRTSADGIDSSWYDQLPQSSLPPEKLGGYQPTENDLNNGFNEQLEQDFNKEHPKPNGGGGGPGSNGGGLPTPKIEPKATDAPKPTDSVKEKPSASNQNQVSTDGVSSNPTNLDNAANTTGRNLANANGSDSNTTVSDATNISQSEEDSKQGEVVDLQPASTDSNSSTEQEDPKKAKSSGVNFSDSEKTKGEAHRGMGEYDGPTTQLPSNRPTTAAIPFILSGNTPIPPEAPPASQ